MTLLSVVCLLCVPGFLLMTHRGIELLPLVFATLGWLSFLASCLLNNVSLLWPNAVAPAAFSLYLMGFTVLTDRSVDRVAAMLAGIGVGTVGFFVLEGIELTRTGDFGDLWKYGIAHGVTIVLLFALTTARVSAVAQAGVLAVVGVGTLALNFRAHALVCLVASVILVIHRLAGARIGRAWQFAGVALFALLFSYVMPLLARAGVFGADLQRKIVEQQSTQLPALLAGRTEPPMTLTAISERPLLGWGSAMNLTPDVYAQAEHLAIRMGFPPTFPFELYWRLPASDYSAIHSILLGSWAEGGVLAVLLPTWLLVMCVGVVWHNARFGRWAPLVLTVALQGAWDLLYSPWTYNMIPEFACLALLFAALGRRREGSWR
ncbi:hypothetical protein AWB99_01965 [Mycolicibacterium confluentis]|nr:hypothetical protein [Mycolicibacterium confluentis]ORV34879.1 hypothetical protein AWB99_01965 [Mycolicibacterium confluentis]